MVAFSAAAWLIYSYYLSLEDRSAVEQAVTDQLVVEPYEVGRLVGGLVAAPLSCLIVTMVCRCRSCGERTWSGCGCGWGRRRRRRRRSGQIRSLRARYAAALRSTSELTCLYDMPTHTQLTYAFIHTFIHMS